MMAVNLWEAALLSLVFFSFCCDGVTITTGTQATPGSSMITTTSAAKNATSHSTNPTTIIKGVVPSEMPKRGQSSQSPDTQTNTTDRLKKVTEAGPKISAGTAESSTKIPVSSASSLNPAILGQSSLSPDTQINTTDRFEKTQETGAKNNSNDTNLEKPEEISYSGIILPVVIALIVISVIVFLLMALYRMCLKTTPERQENGTEHSPSEKENVKLISVKTTSPESGEPASQGKNKTQQPNDSSSTRQGTKRV